MKIVKYQCGCIGLRAPGQVETIFFLDCPATQDDEPHTPGDLTVVAFDQLPEATQAEYGYLIHRLLRQGRQLRLISKFLSGMYI